MLGKSDTVVLGTVGLEKDMPMHLPSPGTPRHLREQLKQALRSTKIRNGERRIGGHHTDQSDIGVIVAFRNHLSAHQDINITIAKRAQNTLVGGFGAGSVAIHACQTSGGKQRPQDLIHLLRTEAEGIYSWTGAGDTDRRGQLRSIAIMTFEGTITPMISKRDTAMGA